MLRKIKNKVRKFFEPLLNEKNLQKGVIPIIGALITYKVILAILALTATGVLIAKLPGFFGNLGTSIAAAVPWLLMQLGKGLFFLTTELFQSVVSSDFVASPVTKDAVFILGFDIVRNFANIFIVLGFVVVGIATILRIQEYQFQKTLLSLIIVAILVNFSPVLCGLVIDATNITTNYLLGSSGIGGIGGTLYIEMTKGVNETLTKFSGESQDELAAYVLANWTAAIMFFVAAINFGLLSLLFVLRKVMLLVLATLAPIAFIAYPFKATKGKIFDKWLHSFVEWALVGVTASFFIYLAGQVLMARGGIGEGASLTDLNKFILPMVYLFMAFKLAIGTKAMGAAAVIGLATTGAGFVAGKAAGGAKAIGGKVGGAIRKSKLGTKVEGGLRSVAEKIPVLGAKPGNAGQWKAKEREEAEKRMANMFASDPDKAEKALQSGYVGMHRLNPHERAGLVDTFREQGKFDSAKHGKFVDGAVKLGYKRSDFEKADPNSVGEAAAIEHERQSLIKAGLTEKQAAIAIKKFKPTQKHIQAARAKVVQGMNTQELRKLNPNALTPEVVGAMTGNQVKTAFQRGTPEQIKIIKLHLPTLNNAGLSAAAANNEAEFNRLSDLVEKIQRL